MNCVVYKKVTLFKLPHRFNEKRRLVYIWQWA